MLDRDVMLSGMIGAGPRQSQTGDVISDSTNPKRRRSPKQKGKKKSKKGRKISVEGVLTDCSEGFRVPEMKSIGMAMFCSC